jgi:hypothetical protein
MVNLNIKKTFAAVLQIKYSNSRNAALLIAAMDKYMIPRKTDSKAPPAPVSLDIASLLPSLENTKVALFHTWGDILNNQLIVTGAHCWVPSTLGSVLFVTEFDSYVETVLKVCIDRILLHYIQIWVSRW